MAKQPETKFKEKVQKKLKQIPKLHCAKIQQVAIRGTPDMLICFRGWFIAWELKVPPNPTTALQDFNLERIAEAGGIARVVTPQTLEAALQELLDLERL